MAALTVSHHPHSPLQQNIGLYRDQSLCDAVTLPGATFVTVTKRRGLSVKAVSYITPLPTVSAGDKVW